MGSAEQDEYAAFNEKVRRTVFLDNLSPLVTESVVRTALDQYGTVKSVEFIPNYLEPRNMPRCALVEMEKQKQAEVVISTLSELPFMMSGMPRPVRACAAVPEMFGDRPRKPGRQLHVHWLAPSDPNAEVANKLKKLVKKHATETAVMLKHQLEKEEKLAKQQGETLKANCKKYEMIDTLMADGTVRRLARRYNLRISDDSGPSTFH
ncbi:ASI1-Immunoprecipitated Protein 1, enhanced downy mildew 3 [Hibiscus trionum]|uniref:ASI1-Immunoprecipitated Protein 1, enhanced downy mildew 3 n=1 Tax=Hibiscus trionum TaxID=183268 RepID=A0A9W7IBG4_HIBTR|nr:ASI1-Immunoprecipitated Protein 1, enhanced downy mildew 3 [Hibiscus trionum]